jgi:hypothetical protein
MLILLPLAVTLPARLPADPRAHARTYRRDVLHAAFPSFEEVLRLCSRARGVPLPPKVFCTFPAGAV